MELIINGKFFGAALEGMPRVGREVVRAFDELQSEGSFPELTIRIMTPQNTSVPQFKNIKVSPVGKLNGVLWEQIELPFYARKGYILNFTGTAPIVSSRGCVVLHDAQFRSTPQSHGWKTYFLYGIISPLASRRSAQMITVSNYAKNEIRQYNITKRDDINVIYNGVDHILNRLEDPLILKNHGLVGKKFMLANSYAHTHKNVKTLFAAMKMGGHLLGPLVLFGSHIREEFEHLGIDIPENVIFTGRITDESLVSLMKSATLFLFPSTTEGFGFPPLEAMALGCPAICAEAGAMPEVCGQGANYATPFSAEGWLEQIRKLWNDEELHAHMSLIGAAQARRYRWKETALQYLNVLTKGMGVARYGHAK